MRGPYSLFFCISFSESLHISPALGITSNKNPRRSRGDNYVIGYYLAVGAMPLPLVLVRAFGLTMRGASSSALVSTSWKVSSN